MLSKKQLPIVFLGAFATFFIIIFFTYMFYIKDHSKNIEVNPIQLEESVDTDIQENQAVLSQQISQIQSTTNVIFKTVDQFGMVIQTDTYPGINWRDLTESQIAQMFSDYRITKFNEEQVVLTREVERQIGSNFIVTTQGEEIIIAIEKNGSKIFYRNTGLRQTDVSDKLYSILNKGISITMEQKEAILRDVDELYVILQEHDE